MKKKLKAALCFYIDVGQLPPDKAEAFIESHKKMNEEFLSQLPDEIGTLWFPVRTPALTRVEICYLTTKGF